MTRDEQNELFQSFWDIGDKILQDAVLLGYIKRKEKKTSYVNPQTKSRENYWHYSVKSRGVEKEVCRKFLLSVLQISEMRLRTVQNSLKVGAVLDEKRGSHSNRPNKIDGTIWNHVVKHWSLLPYKEAHYSRAKSERKYFENPELTVTKLYAAFKQYYFDTTGRTLKMKYSTYHRFWRENSEYSFRAPRSDKCDFCSESEALLKADPNNKCKTAYLIHKKKVEAYKTVKQTYIHQINSSVDCSTLVLEFDYGQNLPLPKLNVTAQFYKRLLWLYVFNVYCHNDGNSAFYCFVESESKKNPNTVCSFLYDFIEKQMKVFKNVKKAILLSDSCGGQNKNLCVVMFCTWLSKSFGMEVEHIFPVRGHSYNQCDRNFGLYGTLTKRVENIEVPKQYLALMKECRQKPMPFEVLMASHLIKDWSTALKSVFNKVPQAKGYKFCIQKYVRIHYSKNGVVSGSETYTNVYRPFKFINQKVPFLEYSGLNLVNVVQSGVKSAKKTDVLSLTKYLKPENAKWFEDTLNTAQDDRISDNESDTEFENPL